MISIDDGCCETCGLSECNCTEPQEMSDLNRCRHCGEVYEGSFHICGVGKMSKRETLAEEAFEFYGWDARSKDVEKLRTALSHAYTEIRNHCEYNALDIIDKALNELE